jgi:putative sterol carrier protein
VARFPGPEWLVAYAAAIESNDELREAARGWEGDITLVVVAEPDNGVPDDVWAWFDLTHGEFSGAKLVTPDEGERARFVIKASYSIWKDVIRGRIEPIRGMTQGKLKLSGDLPEITKHMRAVSELVSIAAQISTEFADE